MLVTPPQLPIVPLYPENAFAGIDVTLAPIMSVHALPAPVKAAYEPSYPNVQFVALYNILSKS